MAKTTQFATLAEHQRLTQTVAELTTANRNLNKALDDMRRTNANTTDRVNNLAKSIRHPKGPAEVKQE
ncbi:hypothetical protein FBU31_003912 [Coemansia sp. 'formosensis']|nr:hypothetical protein FBU31_003912 [Coemansia sp. 'formosensis']